MKTLHSKDVEHLDKIPLGKGEEHGQTGKYAAKRRPSQKTLHDINFLMDFVTKEVVRRDAMATDISLESVDRMFAGVSDVFSVNG